MSNKHLSTIAVDVIEACGNTTINVIHAYRVGGERVAKVVDERWASVVKTSGKRLSKDLRANLIDGQKKVSGLYVQGLKAGTVRAEDLVQGAVSLAHKGVKNVAANATRFDGFTNLDTVGLVTRVAMPAATTAAQFADLVETRSDELVKRVAGKPVRKAAAKRKPAARKAVTRTATAAKPVRKAVKAAKPVAAVKPARKAVAKPVATKRRAAPRKTAAVKPVEAVVAALTA